MSGPERLPCPDCEDGTVYGFKDCWDSSNELHYTVNDNQPCERCKGDGSIEPSEMTERELLAAGYAWDEDALVRVPR